MKLTTIIIILLLIPSALATTYHTTLLTVSEEEWAGGTADMYLELRPGSGNIFMDSFPITRTDTQFSTRFANEVACDFLRAHCDRFDFFYTIRAESTIVGGPSAGAAIAVLTVAALDNQDIRQDVAMTGTINSGGGVGPVAGIIPKAKAAKKSGITTVVIPALAALGLDRRNSTNISKFNTSIEYDELVLENLSDETFTVVQAADLYDALPYFIDKEYPPPSALLEIPHSYEEIMSDVTNVLCERRNALVERNDAEENNRSLEISENVQLALEKDSFYSAASYCFTQNIELQKESLEQLRPAALRVRVKDVGRELFLLDTYLNQENLTTISDVETLAIVRERILEATDRLQEINVSNISTGNLAYVIERTFSARVWSEFFAMDSREYVIEDQLRTSCLKKISEAEERITYIEGLLPSSITDDSREELYLARKDLNDEEFAPCLFKASKAKARANVLSSVWSVSEDRVELLIEQKLSAVERVLARQAELDTFPIMGYSYYEYAQNLAEDQPYSALTFAEYALELSNLQMYFPEEDSWWEPVFFAVDWEHVGVFLIGLLTGIILFWIVKKN